MSEASSNQPSLTLLARENSGYSTEGAQESKKSKGSKRNTKASPEAAALGNNSNEVPVSFKNSKRAKDVAAAANAGTRRFENRSRSPAGSSHSTSPPSTNSKSHNQQSKRPMRTVDDVLNRIKHDPLIQSDRRLLKHFVIAYVDRVFGDQEIPFEEFFSNKDYKEIPLHRISYLRYCDEIVWNRALKYDAIYGSSNTDLTLQHWLEHTDELVAEQEERWAYLVAADRKQESIDAQLLKKLDWSIAEQRESIAAMQNAWESNSAATSGFDFSETKREHDLEQEFENETELTEDLMDTNEDAKPIETSAVASSSALSAAVSVSIAPVAASAIPSTSILDSTESLPARARGGRNARQPAATVTASTGPVPISAPPAIPVPAPSPTPAAPAPPPPPPPSAQVHEADPSAAYTMDSSNVSFSVSLFDSSTGQIVRTVPVHLSLALTEFDFLKKRIASKLNLKGGKAEVKRLYVHGKGNQSVKVTEANFTSLLRDGCTAVLMREEPAGTRSAASLFDAPKRGTEEGETDLNKLQQIDATSTPVASGSANNAKFNSSSSSSASGSAKPPAAAPKPATDRPNFFISLRITNPEIIATLTKIQQGLVAYNAGYKPFLVPVGTFHITLSLLCIKNAEDEAIATKTLQEVQPRIAAILHDSEAAVSNSLEMPIQNLSSFGGKVLYADLPRSEVRSRLNRVAAVLSEAFEQAGVGCSQNKRAAPSTGDNKYRGKFKKESRNATVMVENSTDVAAEPETAPEAENFTPHLTLAKMSRAPSGGHKKKYGKDKHKSKVRPLKSNTGMEEMADAKEEASEEAQKMLNASMEDVLPPKPNQFSALQMNRTESTESTSSVASTESTEAAPASAPVLNPSTSVIRRIDEKSYSQWQKHDFGTQTVQLLDLCAMQGAKQADGYYRVISSIQV